MTKRTPALETALLHGFAAGRSLAALCREHGIARMTFQNWKRDDPDFARRYEEAKADHVEALVDDCLDIAENPDSDWVESRVAADAQPHDSDHIRHARLRIDARLRMARIYLRQREVAAAREERQARAPEAAREKPYEVGDILRANWEQLRQETAAALAKLAPAEVAVPVEPAVPESAVGQVPDSPPGAIASVAPREAFPVPSAESPPSAPTRRDHGMRWGWEIP